MLTSNVILIIGASWEQVPLIRKAKELGCKVVATSPTQEAEGFSLADYTEVADPRNLKHILEIANKYSANSVTADSCDYSNYAAMFLRNAKGWRNYGMDAAQVTTNKHWMRVLCQKNQILQPQYVACRTFFEICEACEAIGFPLIIKPADNRGSFGVNRVDNFKDLEVAYLDAVMNAYSREILLEEYIDGIHLTVDGFMDPNGNHVNLGIASKKVMSGVKPIITEVLYPADIRNDEIEHVLSINNSVISALNIKRGATHSEYILDSNGNCFLIETANRGGGVMTSGIIIPTISGVNISEMLVREAINEPFEVKPNNINNFVMLDFLIFDPGRVGEIKGFIEASNVPGVIYLKLLIKEGDIIESPVSGTGRHGFAIFVGCSREELRSLRDKINKIIRIKYV